MDFLSTFVTIIYYLFVAFICVNLIVNLIKSKSWEKELLYIIVLLPFLLRLLRLK